MITHTHKRRSYLINSPPFSSQISILGEETCHESFIRVSHRLSTIITYKSGKDSCDLLVALYNKTGRQ